MFQLSKTCSAHTALTFHPLMITLYTTGIKVLYIHRRNRLDRLTTSPALPYCLKETLVCSCCANKLPSSLFQVTLKSVINIGTPEWFTIYMKCNPDKIDQNYYIRIVYTVCIRIHTVTYRGPDAERSSRDPPKNHPQVVDFPMHSACSAYRKGRLWSRIRTVKRTFSALCCMHLRSKRLSMESHQNYNAQAQVKNIKALIIDNLKGC